jgi:hypothetical protein
MVNPLAQALSSEEVRAALAELAPGLDELAVGVALRRRLPPSLAREAARLHRLRRRARNKLRSAGSLLLTEKGLEQASHHRVAEARAMRFAECAPRGLVLDATAGIGGDSVALAAAGLPLVAADLDPETADFLAANLRATGSRGWVVRAEAEHPPLQPDLLLLDPDRRPELGRDGRAARRGDPARWSPPWSSCLKLVERVRGACIKMAPGTDPDRLDPPPHLPHSWQWVSLRGELRELALWTGTLALPAPPDGLGGRREVLALDGRGGRAELEGEPETVEALSPEAAEQVTWIAEPDPALIRSGLLGLAARREGLAPLGPAIAYLGGDHPPRSALFRAFSVTSQAPLDRKRVRAMLAEQGIGPITVKKRGHPDDAATLERRLRGKGKGKGLVIVTRLARGHRAYLVRPEVPPEADPEGAPEQSG